MFEKMLIAIFYLGPETIMPLASILAAVIGVLLIFWRSIANLFKRIFKKGGISVKEEMSEELIDPDTQDQSLHGK
jgi:hypothetical protein